MRLEIRADWIDELAPTVQRAVESRVASRLFKKDAALWGAEAQSEAAIRLGWVTAHESAGSLFTQLKPIRDVWLAQGVKRIVLCGMGGSSLAPEVMAKHFTLPITIMDATSPDQVAAGFHNPSEIAVVIASKSGSTVETDSQRRLAIKLLVDAGIEPQRRMLVITDPNSPLEQWALAEDFPVVNADPTVGGRYSALTAFGLGPIFMAGGDVAGVASDAAAAASLLMQDSTANPAVWLAALLAGNKSELSSQGHRDKVLLASSELPGLPDWVEQLVAESTGKESKGTLPIAVQPDDPDLRRELADALRVSLVAVADSPLDPRHEDVRVVASLGEQFLLWEAATAILGYLLGINPFDQPDVESAKQAARGLLSEPQQTNTSIVVDDECAIRSHNLGQYASLKAALNQFAAAMPEDGYLALLAFASRPEHPRLEALRSQFALRLGRPTSFGWGPRYLHSTGQYHKGGPQQGAFLQIRIRSDFDLAVPSQPFSFGDLLRAQADGDAAVLAARGRPVLILEFEDANSAEKSLRSFCEGSAH